MRYKIIEIENLVDIQQEIITNLDNIVRATYTKFHILDHNNLQGYCPSLIEFLKIHGLYERWKFSFMSILNPDRNRIDIHRDNGFYYVLNIPILNCDNSFTVYYESKKGKKPKITIYDDPFSNIKQIYQQFDGNDVIEVDRYETNQPAFMNVGYIHTGISYNKNRRMLLSVRFSPKLSDSDISKF